MYRDEVGHSGLHVTAAGDKQNIDCTSEDDFHDEAFSEGPTLHTIQKQANSAAWERIRHRLLHAIVEGAAMPPAMMFYQICNVKSVILQPLIDISYC